MMARTNTYIDQSRLLTALSKTFVKGELGLDPKNFAATADTAWISLAARLLQRQSQARPLRKTISSK